MIIRAGFRITYDCDSPSPMMLVLSVRPELHPALQIPEVIAVTPHAPTHAYRDVFDNVVTRVILPPGRSTFSADFRIAVSDEPDPVTPDAVQHRIEDLPDEVLLFLLGSRYCETDALVDEAWALFGSTPPGWARVQAIVDHVHGRIRFGYAHARATRTAAQANAEQVGVCRDFAHLAVAFCRCMNIPARYCTGYLGDIRVAPVDAAMDFSAWFEVYLGGGWRTFDARHNSPRIGRIPMAYGRDATDVAIATTFGSARLAGFEVIAEEVAGAVAGSAGP